MSRLIVTAGRNLQTLPASVFSRIVQPFLRASMRQPPELPPDLPQQRLLELRRVVLDEPWLVGQAVEQRSIGPHVHGADSVRERVAVLQDSEQMRFRPTGAIARRIDTDDELHRFTQAAAELLWRWIAFRAG